MAIDALDLLKTALGSLKSDVGKRLVGLFFVIQLFNFAGSMLSGTGAGTVSMTVGFLATLVAALLGIVGTIGGFRAFSEGELKKEMFTENILWPFGRILGANLTSTIFAYLIAVIALIPAFAAGGLTGITSASGLSAASALVIGLGGLGIILAIGAFFYVAVTLILAQPLIAIKDKRMFQALDESIRRTKGERSSIFLALFGLIVIYLTTAVIAAGIGGMVSESVAAALTTLVVAPVMTPVSLSLLNQLVEELPEAE